MQVYVDNDANLIGSDDQKYDVGIGDLQGCQGLNGATNIAAGDSIVGCVRFELPTGVQPNKFQFTPGFGGETVQWKLR
jgi:hypothetical protein